MGVGMLMNRGKKIAARIMSDYSDNPGHNPGASHNPGNSHEVGEKKEEMDMAGAAMHAASGDFLSSIEGKDPARVSDALKTIVKLLNQEQESATDYMKSSPDNPYKSSAEAEG